ncbi:MAG: 50S ribosomal protein L4 [Proteobacteria bacterium]|nr:50S ribosomal protein L4 [Pseudomonadota bacterium]
MTTKVLSLDNKAAGDIELEEAIFGVEVRRDILHRVVNWQLAKRQAGTHKTKQRSEVTGSTKKPWRQKGLGRARAGSVKSPIWRGGGVVFGPTPRSHGHKLNKKLRKIGLCNALSAKQAEGKLVVIDTAKLASPKTKDLVDRLIALGWGRALIIDGPQVDENFARAAANIPNLDVLPQQGANVYDILRRDTLVLTRDAVEHLQARLR